ncbi:MAG: AzlD domain-containing protein [Erysipelotrichaceae bacterium]|nr:AzlD domain-containing protein [Erysipelotrichaceae bacterium]MBQ1534402.1 AzlD domain-containing protein [Erysipelotrichaceae bacterium]MBQ5804961.1 AzlD domain-containing protein [Erysipelotrichaceae bacterium]
MKNSIYIYILLMAVTVFIIRVLPLTLIRKPIQNLFIRSFLYYVPYVTLSVMTFPAILRATASPVSGIIALILGMIGAYKELGLFKVTLICCISVLLLEMFI